MKKCAKKMKINEHREVVKLFHFLLISQLRKITHLPTLKDIVELEKLYDIECQFGSYENKTACRNFVDSVAEYFFNKEVGESLKKINFIAVLWDASTSVSPSRKLCMLAIETL